MCVCVCCLEISFLRLHLPYAKEQYATPSMHNSFARMCTSKETQMHWPEKSSSCYLLRSSYCSSVYIQFILFGKPANEFIPIRLNPAVFHLQLLCSATLSRVIYIYNTIGSTKSWINAKNNDRQINWVFTIFMNYSWQPKWYDKIELGR